jgi:CheY-like chemotaxis protein
MYTFTSTPETTKELTLVKVLVIDDDPSVRYMIIRLMTKHHHDVEEASNVREAVTKLLSASANALRYDLIIVDETNLDFVRYCKTSPIYRDLPIIVLSSVGNTTTRQSLHQLGVNTVLAKPFSSQSLMDMVKTSVCA